MPTPGGLPKAGDVYREKDSRLRWEVAERRGNHDDYVVILRPLDGQIVPRHRWPIFGEPGTLYQARAQAWLAKEMDLQ